MSTITGNIKTVNAQPKLTQLKIVPRTNPDVVGSAIIDLSEQYVVPDQTGFFAVLLVVGLYEFWVGSNRVFIDVPDDALTYSFETLIIPSIPPATPITGSAVNTASSAAQGIVKTDDTVLDPVAVTGFFYKDLVAAVRSAITNKTNNKIAFVKGNDGVFKWDGASLAADDGTEGTSAIRLNDTGALDPGRFLKMALGGGGGGGATAPLSGSGSPEGAVAAPPGTPYTDVLNSRFWTKITGIGTTGWLMIGGLG